MLPGTPYALAADPGKQHMTVMTEQNSSCSMLWLIAQFVAANKSQCIMVTKRAEGVVALTSMAHNGEHDAQSTCMVLAASRISGGML